MKALKKISVSLFLLHSFYGYTQDTISLEKISIKPCTCDSSILCYFKDNSLFTGVAYSRIRNITTDQSLIPSKEGLKVKPVTQFSDSTSWGYFYNSIKNGLTFKQEYERADGSLTQVRSYATRKKQYHFYNSPNKIEDGMIAYSYKLYRNGNTKWTKFYDKTGKLTRIAKFNKDGALANSKSIEK